MDIHERMICGVCEIADGLLAIASFGSLRKNFAFSYTARCEMRRLRRMK
jgi:hypothetical protein